MPSDKTRINLTVPPQTEKILQRRAHRESLSLSTMALQLIQHALELEEDEALFAIAQEREQEKAKFVTHKNAW